MRVKQRFGFCPTHPRLRYGEAIYLQAGGIVRFARRLGLTVSVLLAATVPAVKAQPYRVPPVRTIAQLGTCTTHSPKIVAIVNGLSTADCTVGGGAVDALCACRNGAWVAFGNAGSGTVTSLAVSLSGLSWLTVSGSPVTTSGTFAFSAATGLQAHRVLGTGAGDAIALEALTALDIPALPYLPTTTTYAAASTAGGAASSVATGAIVNSSVASGAAIVESKLALNFPTHSNANDPTAGQKAAFAGSSGTPSALNPYATAEDSRLFDSRTPLSHGHVAADVVGTATRCARFNASGQLAAASGDCSAGDTNTGPATYAASASAAGPATSALSVTGFTSSRCARFDSGGALVAASADCPGGDTVGSPAGSGTEIQVRSGSSFSAVTGSSVSGADVTLAGTLNIGGSGSGFARLQSSGSSILNLYNGDSSDWAIVNGQRFRAIASGSVGANVQGNLGLELAAGNSVSWSSNGSDATQAKDASVSRSSAAVAKIGDALRLYPRSSPPVSCGAAGTAGVIYFDSDSSSFCGCNGTIWAPGFGTLGPCS